jgi:hypothetical protein
LWSLLRKVLLGRQYREAEADQVTHRRHANGSGNNAFSNCVILRLTGLDLKRTRALAEAGDSRRASMIRTPFSFDVAT